MALEGQSTQSNSAQRSSLLRAQTNAARIASLRSNPIVIRDTPLNNDGPQITDRESSYFNPERDNPLSQNEATRSSLQPKENLGAEGKSKATETEGTEGKEGANKDFSFDTSSILQQATNAKGLKAKFQAIRTEAKRQAANAVKKQVQKEVKQAAKAGARRALMAIVDSLAGSLDASTAGLTTIVDWIMYALTFGWLNVEMIYGTFIAEGKSAAIAPLTADPIPLPFDKKSADLMVIMALIAIDVLLGVVLVAVMMFAGVVLYVISQIMTDPNAALQFFITNGMDTGLFSILKSFISI